MSFLIQAIRAMDSRLGARVAGLPSWGHLSPGQLFEFYKYFTMTTLKPADVSILHQLEYWTQVRCGYLHKLQSHEMKKVYNFTQFLQN